jgi:hypothetical protein
MRQRLNPFKRTSPSGKHSTTRNPFKRTKPKMKTGNPERMKRRDRIPRRSALRPKPYKRASARSLWRIGLGLPVRNRKNRLRRPTAAQRRRARRTIRLRALARAWAFSKLPARFSRWHWDRIFSKIPGPINPEWLKPTVKPTPPKPPTPPSTPPSGPGLATVIPIHRKGVPSMSTSPHEVIADAFNQLAQFEPEGAGDWERFLASQHEMFTGMSQAYQTLADRAHGGHGFNAQTAEQLQDLAAAVGSLAGMAEGAHQAFGFNQ